MSKLSCTYGKSAREFGASAFRFSIVGGRFPALVFRSGANEGEVAYWLRRSVTIPQDRTLLPSDEEIYTLAGKTAVAWISEERAEGGVA